MKRESLDFNPNSAAQGQGIFGLPYGVEESKLILLPVPWEATTSYGGGTSKGPQAILKASWQVDLFDLELGNFYENGIFLAKESSQIKKWNQEAKTAAQKVIKSQDRPPKAALQKVNSLSASVNEAVYKEAKKWLDLHKIVGLVGGDHSTPYGTIKAHLEKYPQMGILHFDAHADMRQAYEGFEHSHASIMYNVLTDLPLQKLVQVGIRDFCDDEFQFIKRNESRVETFFDSEIKEKSFSGVPWKKITEEIIEHLPGEVYISFDIDGLDPVLCPSTGTPVPGGLSFNEALHIIKTIVTSGRRIIGFDLNEVAPGETEWDANVGARLLYKLCGWTLHSPA